MVESAYNFRFHRNELRNNVSKDPPPISAGVTKSDGVVLSNVQNGSFSNNFVHDNGSIGLWLGGGNSVFGNRFENNGTQQWLPGSGFSGGSIMTGDRNNTRNEIFDNDVSGGYWVSGLAERSLRSRATAARHRIISSSPYTHRLRCPRTRRTSRDPSAPGLRLLP